MKTLIKLTAVLAAMAGYYFGLRYFAPSNEPYYILGIGLVGYAAWILGSAAGLIMIGVVTPLTLLIYRQFDVSISFTTSPPYIALQVLIALFLGQLRARIQKLADDKDSLMEVNEKLRGSLSQVMEMGGIHSLCTSCKSILDDDGTWTKIDAYLKEKTKAEFSHGLCPDCAKEMQAAFIKQNTPEPDIRPAKKKPA